MPEEDGPHHGQLPEGRREGGAGEHRLQIVADGHIAPGGAAHVLPDELPRPGAENGQGQAGDVLVGPQGDGEEGVDEGGEGPGQKGEHQGQEHRHDAVGPGAHGALVVERGAQAHGATHVHHALHAQVQVARLFGQNLPQGAVEQGHAVEDRGGEQSHPQAAVDVTHLPPPPFPCSYG